MRDDMLELVEERLTRWAEWDARMRDGLGYPRESPIHRMMRDGTPIQSTRRPHWNEEQVMAVEECETDRIVSGLPDTYKLPIQWAYLHRYKRTHDKRMAEELGISVRTLYLRLRDAKYILLGRFWQERKSV
jgi:hypothetical protein